jgi:hypothetical protein
VLIFAIILAKILSDRYYSARTSGLEVISLQKVGSLACLFEYGGELKRFPQDDIIRFMLSA